ncbi:RES family NAD+ phosphorylase [Glutamicibacter arilaitensis]
MVRYVPGQPFDPEERILESGTPLYRVFSNARTGGVTHFNPGFGSATRFAFFGEPAVAVLYAAQTEEAAVCETILHEVPPGPGRVMYDNIADKICAPLTPTRNLRLVSLMGDGPRNLQTEAKLVTGTSSSQYGRTVRWAEAAHKAGFEGMVWMSNRRSSDRDYVFFGDRVIPGDLTALGDRGRIFAAGPDFDWLGNYLAGLGIDIMLP